jgi:acyl transferase domain-containing protein
VRPSHSAGIDPVGPCDALSTFDDSRYAVECHNTPPERLIERYRAFVEADPDLPLEDVCYTANTGRHPFETRFAAVFCSRDELLAQLASAPTQASGSTAGGVAFMFTGQGSQYAGMGRDLYRGEPVFRAALDRCAEILRDELDHPLIELLHPADPADAPGCPLDQTLYTQPALFAVEYALAQLWLSLVAYDLSVCIL